MPKRPCSHPALLAGSNRDRSDFPELNEGGSLMGKGSRLADRRVHRDGSRIIRSRVGARAAAGPVAETIKVGWRCANRESRATSMPTASGIDVAACPSAHGQEILGAEFSRVGRALGWGDGM